MTDLHSTTGWPGREADYTLPRLRRHTDGRTAVKVLPDTDELPWLSVCDSRIDWLANDEVTGEGWTELVVIELPQRPVAVGGPLGVCPICREEFALDAHGQMFPHTRRWWPRGTVRCDGSGMEPWGGERL